MLAVRKTAMLEHLVDGIEVKEVPEVSRVYSFLSRYFITNGQKSPSATTAFCQEARPASWQTPRPEDRSRKNSSLLCLGKILLIL